MTETNSESTVDEEVLPQLEIQTSDTLTIPQGANEVDITTFTAGLTGNANNKMRVYIVAAGTSTANLNVKLEW